MYVVLTDSRSYETEDEGHKRRKLYEILLQRTKCQVSKSVESCMKPLFSTSDLLAFISHAKEILINPA